MGISLKPERLKRYRDLAWLLVKYGRSDLASAAGLDVALDTEASATGMPASAEELATDLERLGPTYVKLGQLFSTRADLIPPPYLQALSRLQDNVEPFGFGDVERIVAEELGVRLSKAFVSFEARPIAAASLGQVHRARLRDGRRVAVKVQRPEVPARVTHDLQAFADLAALVDDHTELGQRYGFRRLVAEFRDSVLRELDYRLEADNLRTLGTNLAAYDRLVVPSPIDDLTTARVLTMTYVPGVKLTTLSPVVLLEIDRQGLLDQLFRAYLEQVLVDGFFHADPHPGNVVLTGDGRLALLDLGMVARVTPATRDHLLQFLLALSEGRADDAVAFAMKLGDRSDPSSEVNERALTRQVADLVARTQHAEVAKLDIGQIMLAVMRASGDAGLRLPPELAMLGKTLLNLDQIARTLDPEFDPNAAIRRHASVILRDRVLSALTPGHLGSGLLEAKELIEHLPRRINRILDRLAGNAFEVRVHALDERRLIAGIQKVANRITVGLLLAALIIAAAMLMRVETSLRILGYPGFAMICFLLAAGGAVALMLSIFLGDE